MRSERMRRESSEHRQPTEQGRPAAGPLGLLDLQRSAGNRTTTQLLGNMGAIPVQRRPPTVVDPGDNASSRFGETRYSVEEPNRDQVEAPEPALRPVVELLPAALEEWERFVADGIDTPDRMTHRRALEEACHAVLDPNRHSQLPNEFGPQEGIHGPGGARGTGDSFVRSVSEGRRRLLEQMLRWDERLGGNELDNIRQLALAGRAVYPFSQIHQPISQHYSMTGTVGYGISAEFVITNFHGDVRVTYSNDLGMQWTQPIHVTGLARAEIERRVRAALGRPVDVMGHRFQASPQMQDRVQSGIDHLAGRYDPAGADVGLGFQAHGQIGPDRQGNRGSYTQDDQGRATLGPGVPPPDFDFRERPLVGDPTGNYFSPNVLETAVIEMDQVSAEISGNVGGHGLGGQVNITHDIIFRRPSLGESSLRFVGPHASSQPPSGGRGQAGFMVGARTAVAFGGAAPGGPEQHRRPSPVPSADVPPWDTRGYTGEWRDFLTTMIHFDTGQFSSGDLSTVPPDVVRQVIEFLREHPDYSMHFDVTGSASPRWREARGQGRQHLNQALSDEREYVTIVALRNAVQASGADESVRSRLELPAEEDVQGAGSFDARRAGVTEQEDPAQWRRVDIVVKYTEIENVHHYVP